MDGRQSERVPLELPLFTTLRPAQIDAARGYLSRSGGGELNIHGKDNKIRAKDTIDPGNDPRNTSG
jgi:hypothetical protein